VDKLDLRQAFFQAHPDPMWIYDVETLAFLDVNHAAERVYRWSRTEFLKMTLLDIRPPDEAERLKAQVAATTDVIDASGIWQHCTRDGRQLYVDVVSHSVVYEGRPARFISARDVTRLVDLERERTAVLESISDGFFTLDREERFTFLNGRAAEYLGRPRDELLGRNIWEVFPEARGTAFEGAVIAASVTRETQEITELLDPPGRWYQSTVYPADGGFTVYFRDVTQERAAQKQLRLLEQAVSHLNDVVLITEARPIDQEVGGPRVVYVNDAFVRLTGYDKDEIIGQTPRMLQGPETPRSELDRIRQALERWEPVRAEVVNYTKDGEPFWFEMEIVPIAAEDGWHTHWVAVQRDVTARRSAEQSIRHSEERFQLLAQATNDVVWDWDIQRDELWWNDNLDTVFGYRPGSNYTPMNFWFERVHPQDRERVQASFYGAIESRSLSVWQEEYRFARSDGAYATIVDRGLIMRDPEGRATRAIGSIIDVTDRRRLEDSVRQSQKLEAVGQLTGGIAHDFNNLLTVILNNAEGLEEALEAQPQLKALAAMTLKAAERGAELTNRLLAVARRQALAPARLDLGLLIQNLRPLLRRTLSEDIAITIKAPTNLWAVEVDPGQLEVALINLAINARDAMPDGGRLRIEMDNVPEDQCPPLDDGAAGRSCVRISVADTGQGMPKAVIARAFEPFFTTKPVGKGSGLGLAMVYGFVRQSGGDTRIRSRPGKGTTVEMFFPSIGGSVDAPSQEEPVVRREGGEEHILVVEDDPFVRSNLTAQLEALGYRVTVAEDAVQALSRLTDEIDLLFTDVVMPGGLNGRELADRAVALKPLLKVLFTSGYSQDALITAGRLPAQVQLLGKPYRRRELAAKVREVLDGTA
jgi:PAS domain S-box-containing protein